MNNFKNFSANEFEYRIDETYKNPLYSEYGIIAKGTESLVYKGKKISKSANGTPTIEIPCVLKFKPYDKYSDFINRELEIFNILAECRSIVKIDDVINKKFEIGSYANGEPRCYFCVVEEYVDGMNLEDYCRNYWNGKEYESKTKKGYENILKYQKTVVDIMKQLAKIMEFVNKKQVLHLDIKPQNIMVTNHDERVVLIDFGRAKKFISTSQPFAFTDKQDINFSLEIDYNTNTIDGVKISETEKNRLYDLLDCRYGTLGYAPPECFSKPINVSNIPFDYNTNYLGKMTVSSDVFAFGATFWEILHYPQILKNTNFIDMHDITHSIFYNEFMNDDLYFNRDLSLTHMPNKKHTHYRCELEIIIIKCTSKYKEDESEEKEENKRFKDFSEVLANIDYLENSLPVINSEDKISYKNSFWLATILSSFFIISLIILGGYYLSGNYIAKMDWDNKIKNYQSGDLYEVKEIALHRIKLGNKDAYNEIFNLFNKENNLNINEVVALVELLKELDSNNDSHIDDIAKNVNSVDIVEESAKEICKLKSENSVGYDLAFSIFDYKNNPVNSYKTLLKYQNAVEYKEFLIILSNRLLEERYCKTIADNIGKSQSNVEKQLKEIKAGLR